MVGGAYGGAIGAGIGAAGSAFDGQDVNFGRAILAGAASGGLGGLANGLGSVAQAQYGQFAGSAVRVGAKGVAGGTALAGEVYRGMTGYSGVHKPVPVATHRLKTGLELMP